MNEREICTVILNLVDEFVKSITELEIFSRMNKDQILDDDIEIEEIELSVKKLKCGKREGVDSISAEHLKHMGWVHKLMQPVLL